VWKLTGIENAARNTTTIPSRARKLASALSASAIANGTAG
jgi:hypothetical protein